jgi:hypothetical protein
LVGRKKALRRPEPERELWVGSAEKAGRPVAGNRIEWDTLV